MMEGLDALAGSVPAGAIDDPLGGSLAGEGFFGLSVRLMRHGLVCHDARGTVIFANPAAERILGLSVDQMRGHGTIEPGWAVVAEDGSPLPDSAHPALEALRTGRPVEGVIVGVRGPTRAGTTWLDVSSVPALRDGESTPHLVYTTFQDITERKQAEEARRDLEARLQQSQKMESLGSLAGGVAHDLNNVLGAILSLATAHRGRFSPPDSMAACLDTITKACVRGRQVVRSLVQFARKNPEDERPFDLNATVRDVAHLLSRTTLQRVRLEADLDGGLPLLRGDAGAISHALINLCVNAVDAMPEGGDLVLTTRQLSNGWLELTVRDTGSGMAPDVLKKATEPFFTTKSRTGGSGLGLSIVHGTMCAHGGTLDLRSRPGRGTRVILRFPPSRRVKHSDLPEPPPLPDAPSAGLAVLVVDDDDLVREAVGTMLELLGHRVHAVPGARQALDALEAGLEAQLVVLDMNMPGMTGAQALPRILAMRPEIAVILSSGYPCQEVEEFLKGHPRVESIAKPFTLDEIQRKMGPLLGLLHEHALAAEAGAPTGASGRSSRG